MLQNNILKHQNHTLRTHLLLYIITATDTNTTRMTITTNGKTMMMANGISVEENVKMFPRLIACIKGHNMNRQSSMTKSPFSAPRVKSYHPSKPV